MISGVYIHYPFCLQKCSYCSFFSVPRNENRDKYLHYLIKEIDLYSSCLVIEPQTVYFGGGTPGLMNGEEIASLLRRFDLQKLTECTIEVNPSAVRKRTLKAWRELSVNRLSIGLQSFNDNELKLLGRTHTGEDNLNVFYAARDEGYDNISVDLIYGLPGQSINDVSRTIKEIVKLAPEHISAYCLSLNEDTLLARQGVDLPADEITAEMYRCIIDDLTAEGYEQYEISNFSRRGYMSKHNLTYWQCKEYIGFGCSAHGYAGNYRYYNPSDFGEYYYNVDNRIRFPNSEEQDIDKKKKDFVIQGLRLTKGIELKRYEKFFNEAFLDVFSKAIEKHKKYLALENGFIRLKPIGYFVSNEIIVDFIN